MKWTGVLLNSNHDGIDGRYGPQGEPASLENGDWHDGHHQMEDGYGDDGQDLVCVLCAQAKRDYNRLPSLEEGD